MLTSLTTNEIIVLLSSETKVGAALSLGQFLISYFSKPLRLDKNSRDDGIMLFMKDNTPFTLLKPRNFPSNTEALFIEIKLRKNRSCAAVTILIYP